MLRNLLLSGLLCVLMMLVTSSCTDSRIAGSGVETENTCDSIDVQLEIIAHAIDSNNIGIRVGWYVIPTGFEPDTSNNIFVAFLASGDSLRDRINQSKTWRAFRVLSIDNGTNCYLSDSIGYYRNPGNPPGDTSLNLGSVMLLPPGLIMGQLTTADSLTGIKAKIFIYGTSCATYSESNGHFELPQVPIGTYHLQARRVLSNGSLDSAIWLLKDSLAVQRNVTIDLGICAGALK